MNVRRMGMAIVFVSILPFLCTCGSAPQSGVSLDQPLAPTTVSPTSPPPPTVSPAGDSDPYSIRFSGTGYTAIGDWSTEVVATPNQWQAGTMLNVQATVRIYDTMLTMMEDRSIKADGLVALFTAERMFDADGHLRLPSDERVSTLVTPTGLAIEGGTQGAVSNKIGYAFRTPVDELITMPMAATKKVDNYRDGTFNLSTKLPYDLPPGLYRLRIDYGVTVKNRYYNLNGEAFAKRPFFTGRQTQSEIYSPIIQASAKRINGSFVDASAIKPRIPWILLANYNSNGYRGVVASEDQPFFALSNRNIIPDDVILPMYDEINPKNVLSYSLEPQFPADTICDSQNIPWDYTKGQLSIQVTQPDGKTVDLGIAPFVSRQGLWPTTKNAKFTQWKPPMYGRYTVKATGWTEDPLGNRYEGGGTYRFWIAKRMTLATATFQGQAYPVGNRYGRDIGLAPAVPADIEVTATLFVNSDPKNVRTISYTGKASPGGMFTASQGLKPLNFDAPGEYQAQVLAKYTDPDGHLWVESMRHAGVIYPEDTPIVAHGKKIQIKNNLFDRGETNLEGWHNLQTDERQLQHINFPYNEGDVLLIASENEGANKIEPVLSWDYREKPMGYDPKIQGIGLTNVQMQTSNGYSPHMFPEYITDWMYYYAAGPRPGLMGRFFVGDDGVRAPYWPTSNTNFGGQINASNNGDMAGDIYRLIGGVVIRKQNQTPMYARYMATGFIIPKGTNNNRVIAPGTEEILGPTGERARIFLAMNARPGIVYDTGMSFAPAFQIDPMLPVNMKFTLYYPDGRTVVAAGVGDATGSWAGKDRWALDVPGMYRYTVESDWNGFAGLVPGMPKEGGAIYVVEKERPANASGITFSLPPLSKIDPGIAAKFVGSSTAKEIHYAMVIPGAVLGQGTMPVNNGKFEFTFDPAALNKIAQTYDVKNKISGKPELADVVHLTFFSKETSPAVYHSFVRLIIRGNTVHYTR